MEMIAKDRLEAEDVRAMCERLLRDHLSFETEGYKISTSMALNVLLTAAVEKRSIEAVCGDLVAVVDSNTLREALNRALTVDDLRQQEAEFNAALVECIPRHMPRTGLEMAIDFHDEPYYGKSEAVQTYTCRGEAHDGTTYFWRIASLYVMWRQVRLTLALTYVLPGESTLSILERLLKRREGLGIHCKVLYLDKGFCSGDIIAYLQDTTQPALIACPIRGKKGRGGTRALCTGRKAYRTSYTFTDGTTADLAVVPTLTRDKKTGKQQRDWLVYVLIHLDWSARKAHQRYHRRFGIESSYRQLGQVRAFTNSRNVALRFFYLALALLLLNIWTFLRCACTRVIATGPFRLDLNLFRLARFTAFLRRATEQTYGTTMSIPIYSW
jgi:putative transposase